jgi:ribonuclease-3
MRTPRRSPLSARRSTTSRRTSSARLLQELIEELPAGQAAAVFTHSSWAADRTDSYERLEFLGDSVLELAVARTLYDRFPEFSEGQLALGDRLRAEAAAMPPEDVERLAGNRNVLAALLEAAIAAIYVQHGFDAVASAVVEAFEPRIQYALHNHVDHKTDLQERFARSGKSVAYQVLEVEGPPHDRTFTAAALLEGEEVGVGRGRSKKDAEQEAAKEALARIEGATS